MRPPQIQLKTLIFRTTNAHMSQRIGGPGLEQRLEKRGVGAHVVHAAVHVEAQPVAA